MERTTVGLDLDVILTAGLLTHDGRQTFGLFASESDARSSDADALALGSVGAEKLTPAQIALAERNSEAL
jgi:hypothetical protein